MSTTKAELITENARLRKRVALLERARRERTAGSEQSARLRSELAEALEQQTATSEILRLIGRSLSNVQPVLDAVAESAARLCESFDADIWRPDGNRLLLVAHHGQISVDSTLPLVRGTVAGRSVLDGRTVHIADVQAEPDEFPESIERARRLGFRTVLTVPLMREGVAGGVISLRRTEAKLFTDRQVALLQTFADQAAIAIENVRLFNETKEALEQQAATSEILRVISQSPTDAQPVFDTIARNAVRLCAARSCVVFRFDGKMLHIVAHQNIPFDALEVLRQQFPMHPSRAYGAGRAILGRAVVELPDLLDDPEYQREYAVLSGFRGVLAVPMLREGAPIGVISINRSEAGSFPDTQISLLQTFADQAVIAVENVRLFKELEARNRDLTATSEILAAITEIELRKNYATPAERIGEIGCLRDHAAQLAKEGD